VSWVLQASQEDETVISALYKALAIPFVLLNLLVLIGTVGFMLVEGWSVLDSLWMAVITLTTIGYGEIHPLTTPGRVFALVYILIALGLFTRVLATAARFIADGQFAASMAARRHRREIATMRDHFIVVGFGRLGREVTEDLLAQNATVLVIDQSVPEQVPKGVRVIVGDATQDEVLHEAAIERAKGIAIATPTDAINVFVTLSVRQLNPSIHIETRVEDTRSASKAKRAGADGVLLPYQIGGRRMAHALLRPSSTAFLEHVTNRSFGDLHMEDVLIEKGSPAAGRSLRDLDLRGRWNVTAIAARHVDQVDMTIPGPETELVAGDTLIVLGHPEDVTRFVEDACQVTGSLVDLDD